MAKASYGGDGSDTTLREFSPKLRANLRSFFPNQGAQQIEPFAQPADEFVNVLLGEARWALSALYWDRFTSTKQELRAVRKDLLKVLHAANRKLRNLAPDFDRLLGSDADPMGCADKIAELIAKLDSAGAEIDKIPTRAKVAERQHRVAVELAVRILRVLVEYGIRSSATANADLDRQSHAVQILKAIGDDIGLRLSGTTWRDTISEAKRAV